jgi:hypothetical protein
MDFFLWSHEIKFQQADIDPPLSLLTIHGTNVHVHSSDVTSPRQGALIITYDGYISSRFGAAMPAAIESTGATCCILYVYDAAFEAGR